MSKMSTVTISGGTQGSCGKHTHTKQGKLRERFDKVLETLNYADGNYIRYHLKALPGQIKSYMYRRAWLWFLKVDH